MAQQTINIGTTPNDGTGDTLRAAMDKSNDNFTELYAALAALSNIDILTVSTTGGTITLNFASEEQRIFVGSASFSGPKTVALSNATNAKRFEFLFQITSVAAVLTFPSEFIGDTADTRWNAGANTWTSDFATGVFRATAIYNGTNWILDISNAPYA